jgi:hypothetical protein
LIEAKSPAAGPRAEPEVSTAVRGVTLRSLIIAAILVPANAYWVAMTETVWYAGFPTTISLFYNVIAILVAITLINSIVRRFAPGVALSHGELLVIYTVLCLTSAMVSHDMLQVLVPIMTYCYEYARPENEWAGLFLDYVPRWLTVDGTVPAFLGGGFSKAPVSMMWEGGTTLYRSDILRAWIVPAGMWTLFLTLLYGSTLGLNTIFRRRWIEAERLTFPIIQLPLTFTQPGTWLVREKLFWTVLAVIFSIDVLNGLHVYYPQVPQIPLTSQATPAFNIGAKIVDHPWNALAWGSPLWLGIYPVALGLCLLLPTELAFSCWFFFFVFKIMRVLANSWGIHLPEGPPYIEEQSFAGYVGLAAFSVWASRSYLKGVWLAVLGRPGALDDSQEPMRYRTAVIWLVGGFFACVIFGWKAGMSLGYALAFFFIYIVLTLAVSRIRAEMGLPAHDLHHAGPGVMLERIVGTANISPQGRTATELFSWFNRAYRAHPAPHQIEGFKLAERTGMSTRPLAWVMLLAIPLGALASFWALLHFMYSKGVAAQFFEPKVPAIFGSEPWNRLTAVIQNPKSENPASSVAIGFGFVATLAMMALKMRVSWWPIHPAGYAVSSSWAMGYLWMPMLMAWAAKSLVTRYGGNKAFRSVVPVAFGLIMGDMAGGCFWSVYQLIAKATLAPYCIWGK